MNEVPHDADLLIRVSDELAIVRTLSRLAQAQDDLDRDAYLSCFTDTVLLVEAAVFEGWKPTELAAGELADQYFDELRRFDAGQHLVTNHVIDVVGDEATCSADLYAVAVLLEDGDQLTSSLGARYFLRLRRSGNSWRIFERSVRVRWTSAGTDEIRRRAAAGGAKR